MFSGDSESSSESEAAAELLESVLGLGDSQKESMVHGSSDSGDHVSCGTPRTSIYEGSSKKEKKRKTAQCTSPRHTDREGYLHPEPHEGLKLELKGLPLQIGPPSSLSKHPEDIVRLQPHQRLLRLCIDGDPDADPAELLSVYLASLGSNPLQASTVLQDRYVQVGGMWYLVQRDASRGEILLGPTPSDIQLLTAERHLGQLRFSRCEEPENHLAEKAEEEEDTTWEARPSFARFHKIEQYGTNVKPKKPKSRRARG
uniref:Uncharacterized protein n=1 Tax=Eimeria tenella TaxID=5802 RepID=H9B956_EIMTE|nr:hypothetical protein [Eimeria tenella]